jgi:hypothetical protein
MGLLPGRVRVGGGLSRGRPEARGPQEGCNVVFIITRVVIPGPSKILRGEEGSV